MKRIIFIMVAMMLSMAASAQTTNKTLYIVDGKVVSEEQAKTIKNEDVVNMNVIEGIESAVIINTTKSANDVVVIRDEKDSDADALKLTVTGAVRNEEMDEKEEMNMDIIAEMKELGFFGIPFSVFSYRWGKDGKGKEYQRC